jgi:hypothetical protein
MVPPTMPIYLGIDGGGTHTRAVPHSPTSSPRRSPRASRRNCPTIPGSMPLALAWLAAERKRIR